PKLLGPVRSVWRRQRIRLHAAAWLDVGLDVFAWLALLCFVAASVANARVSSDFFVGSIVMLVGVLGWWVYRPKAPIGWTERSALYVLGAYAVYLGTPESSAAVYVEWVSCAGVGIWLVYRLVGSSSREFTLTPLDLIVVVTTLCLAVLSKRATGDV